MLVLAAAIPARAQELSGSATATGDYKAEFIPHSRLTGLPSRLALTVPEGKLSICTDPVPAYMPPGTETLQGLRQYYESSDYRGYVSLTGGSYLDMSLNAGYRFIDNAATTAGVWLSHGSTSLYRPDTDNPEAKADRRKVYDQTIGLYASHYFSGAGTLHADVAYRLSYLNYYTSALTAQSEPLPTPNQTLNDFLMKAVWLSDRHARSFFVDGSFAYRYFGYRRFYPTVTEHSPALKPTRENDLTVSLAPGYYMGAAGTLSLGVNSQTLFYIHPHTVADIVPNLPAPFYPDIMPLRTYGVVSLQPSYSVTRGNWSLRAGAKVDLTYDVVSREKFNHIHVAPDVAVSYASDHATFYAAAKGGVVPNTLAAISELDMYQAPVLSSTLPLYSPIDAVIGVRLGSFNGFSAGVHAAYAISDNTPLSGWYPYWLAGKSLYGEEDYKVLSTLSLKGFSLGADIEYMLASVLEVKGAMTYQRQDGEKGYFNGLDRPRWTINASADIYPLKELCLGIGYEYRGVRNLITGQKTENMPTVKMPEHNYDDAPRNSGYVTYRLSDIYNLSVHARYTLKRRYTFSVAADNILSCNPALNPLMPEPGVRFSGGISVLF